MVRCAPIPKRMVQGLVCSGKLGFGYIPRNEVCRIARDWWELPGGGMSRECRCDCTRFPVLCGMIPLSLRGLVPPRVGPGQRVSLQRWVIRLEGWLQLDAWVGRCPVCGRVYWTPGGSQPPASVPLWQEVPW